MLHSLTKRLSVAGALALTASATWGANVPIDVANPINGLTSIFSVTFDPPNGLAACGGGSTVYCTWFGGDPSPARNVTASPTPSKVINVVPAGIGPTGEPVAPVPASGSFLDLTLSGGNTLLTLGTSSVTFATVDICISLNTNCTELDAHAVDAGIVFGAPLASVPGALTLVGGGSTGTTNVPVDGSGKAVFQVHNGGAVVVDFSKFSDVVTICSGSFCSLVTSNVLKLDVVRYVLEIDYNPGFTAFTGRLIGLTQNNSMIFVTLNSAGADQDGDTFVDTADNCPANANPGQENTDGDARGNVCDNCSATANTAAGVVLNSPGLLLAQLDADQDGFGNLCDGDINNSGLTTAGDNTLLRNVLNVNFDGGVGNNNPARSDMNGSGLVTAGDNTLLRNRLNQAPGPSGLACATTPVMTIPCPLAPMP